MGHVTRSEGSDEGQGKSSRQDGGQDRLRGPIKGVVWPLFPVCARRKEKPAKEAGLQPRPHSEYLDGGHNFPFQGTALPMYLAGMN